MDIPGQAVVGRFFLEMEQWAARDLPMKTEPRPWPQRAHHVVCHFSCFNLNPELLANVGSIPGGSTWEVEAGGSPSV